jgi:thiamine-phosphate pyrophosphorylase
VVSHVTPPPPDRRPRDVRLVLVTDPRVRPDELVARVAAVVAAVPAGHVIVQVRDRGMDGGPLLALVRSIQATGAVVWVNDRLDVALAAGAAGVHLPERGLGVVVARRAASITGVGLAIGCSRHAAASASEVDAAEHPALIQLGPIWPTPSKAGVIEPLGPAVLAVRGTLSDRVHLVAVGGVVSAERAREAAAAGADAIAVIRAIWTADDPAAVAAALIAAVDDGRRTRVSNA